MGTGTRYGSKGIGKKSMIKVENTYSLPNQSNFNQLLMSYMQRSLPFVHSPLSLCQARQRASNARSLHRAC